MNEKVENILRQARELTDAERAHLIDALVDGADNAGFATPEIARAWDEEVERRMAAFDRGEIQAINAYEVTVRRRPK